MAMLAAPGRPRTSARSPSLDALAAAVRARPAPHRDDRARGPAVRRPRRWRSPASTSCAPTPPMPGRRRCSGGRRARRRDRWSAWSAPVPTAGSRCCTIVAGRRAASPWRPSRSDQRAAARRSSAVRRNAATAARAAATQTSPLHGLDALGGVDPPRPGDPAEGEQRRGRRRRPSRASCPTATTDLADRPARTAARRRTAACPVNSYSPRISAPSAATSAAHTSPQDRPDHGRAPYRRPRHRRRGSDDGLLVLPAWPTARPPEHRAAVPGDALRGDRGRHRATGRRRPPTRSSASSGGPGQDHRPGHHRRPAARLRHCSRCWSAPRWPSCSPSAPSGCSTCTCPTPSFGEEHTWAAHLHRRRRLHDRRAWSCGRGAPRRPTRPDRGIAAPVPLVLTRPRPERHRMSQPTTSAT